MSTSAQRNLFTGRELADAAESIYSAIHSSRLSSFRTRPLSGSWHGVVSGRNPSSNCHCWRLKSPESGGIRSSRSHLSTSVFPLATTVISKQSNFQKSLRHRHGHRLSRCFQRLGWRNRIFSEAVTSKELTILPSPLLLLAPMSITGPISLSKISLFVFYQLEFLYLFDRSK